MQRKKEISRTTGEIFFPLSFDKQDILRKMTSNLSGVKYGSKGVIISGIALDEYKSWERTVINLNVLFLTQETKPSTKKKIIVSLREKGIVVESWESFLLNGVFCKKEDFCKAKSIAEDKFDEKLNKISQGAVKKKYKISNSKLQKALTKGFISSEGGNLDRTEIEGELEKSKVYFSVHEKMKEYGEKRGIVLNKKIVNLISEEIIKTNNFGNGYKMGEYLLEQKFLPGEVYIQYFPEDKVDRLLKRNLNAISRDNYRYLWGCLDETLSEAISNIFEVRPFSDNESKKNRIHKIMAAFIHLEKPVLQITNEDIRKLERITDKSTCIDCRRVLSYIQTKHKVDYYINTIYPQQFKNKSIREACIPYSYQQFIALGAVLFSESMAYKPARIQKLLQDDEASQAILYMALHYACAWRKGDMFSIKGPDITDLEQLIEGLARGVICREKYGSIWILEDAGTYIKKATASKNRGDLVYAVPNDFVEYMGLYLLIAKYHQQKQGRKYVLTNKAESIRAQKEALGKDFTDIFGDKPFRNRKLNKDYLTFYAKEAEQIPSMNIRTLPNIVAAFLRGHKLDFENGQDSILHYIGHLSDGYSVDEIAYNLFVEGTLGHYKQMVAKILYSKFNENNFATQSKIIETLDIEPAKIEMQLEQIDRISADLSKVGFVKEYSLFKEKIDKRMTNMEWGANEDNVFCLYSALTGERNPDCIGRKNCMGGCKQDVNGLCIYGIYSWHYVYNLLFRVRAAESKINELQKKCEGNLTIEERERLENSIEIMAEKSNHFTKMVADFITSIPTKDSFKNSLIHLFEMGGIPDALPNIY